VGVGKEKKRGEIRHQVLTKGGGGGGKGEEKKRRPHVVNTRTEVRPSMLEWRGRERRKVSGRGEGEEKSTSPLPAILGGREKRGGIIERGEKGE